jgi:hypothetical protein
VELSYYRGDCRAFNEAKINWRRWDQWIASIVEGLEHLEEALEEFKKEDLSSNPHFITTALHATQCAIRSHQQEKLAALRNVVMNTALQNSPEEDTHLIFLNLVDSMASWHLNLFLSIDDEWSWKSFKGDPDSPENSYVVSPCPL